MDNKNIIKLAVDLAKGRVQNFSNEDSNETLRRAFVELTQYSDSNGRIDRKTFRRNQIEIFEILEEILNETIHEGLANQFSDFAEYRNLAWGDQNLFYTPSNDIFRVSMVSDGNGNMRRQRLRDGEDFKVTTETYAIAVGEEFHRFLAKRIDWVEFINLVAESFRRDLEKRIYDAIYQSFQKDYGSTYHTSFTGAPSEDDLVEMAMHIEARTGEKVAVYGTKLALRKLAPSALTDNINDNRNKVGYYGEIAGIQLREIPQAHEYGGGGMGDNDNFAIDNNFVLLLPESKDKMVKVVNEGDAIIQDQQGGQSADMMQEYFIANKFGVSVIPSKVFGYMRFN